MTGFVVLCVLFVLVILVALLALWTLFRSPDDAIQIVSFWILIATVVTIICMSIELVKRADELDIGVTHEKVSH